MSNLLEICGVSAGYGGPEVVKNVNLTVPGGQFCALLGLNASGKTTLIRAVCGLIKPSAGRCLVNGQDVTRLHEHARARYISHIPQRHSALYGVRVFDVVMMGFNASLGLLESPTGQQKEAARATLCRLGLQAHANDDFANLSEGQKQMVILARTLVQDAPVMLLDEPDSALDFINRHAMLGRVRALVKEEGKVGLISIHDPNFALAYCDRLVLLSQGQVVCDLEVQGVGRARLQQGLSAIYGDIRLLESEGQLVMLKE